MADAHRAFAGEVAAWHVAMILARLPFTATAINPAEANPWKVVRPKSEALLRIEEWQRRRRWRVQTGGGDHAGRQGRGRK